MRGSSRQTNEAKNQRTRGKKCAIEEGTVAAEEFPGFQETVTKGREVLGGPTTTRGAEHMLHPTHRVEKWTGRDN